MNLFHRTFGKGTVLEVRRGFGTDGYSSVKVELEKLSKRQLPEVLALLDGIAQKVTK